MDHQEGSPPTSATVEQSSPSPVNDHDLISIPIQTADSPFDKETTDIVLQTSDRFQFHVWKCILAEASPVFEDMFALGQPPSSPSSRHQQLPEVDTSCSRGLGIAQSQSSTFRPSVPIIEVPEDSTTLQLLLRWIYPPPRSSRRIGTPGLGLEDLKAVLSAAHKYQVDGIVLEITDILIKDCRRLGPVRVYALGARHAFKLSEVMQTAARESLSLPPATAYAYVEELEDISGGAYHRLCEYRRQCAATLADMTKDLSWLKDDIWAFKRAFPDCTCDADPTGTRYRLKDMLDEHVISAWEVVHNHIRLIANLMREEVDRRVAAISLEFY
uniref:MHYT domain-containing protein n=1 Tax=Ganoderma boninense TaxID=34458 RepID=A0A5K1K7B0_9APHY|nr:MHYT domain-containing protein [Ganoderma boninense]